MNKDILDLGYCMLSILKKYDFDKIKNDKRLKT